jgi:hypothetical protein
VMILVFHFVERRFARGLTTGDDILPGITIKPSACVV